MVLAHQETHQAEPAGGREMNSGLHLVAQWPVPVGHLQLDPGCWWPECTGSGPPVPEILLGEASAP